MGNDEFRSLLKETLQEANVWLNLKRQKAKGNNIYMS